MPVEHKCHICHKILTRSTILRDHLRSHKGDYAFECSVCGKAFVRNSDRKDHERTHTRQGKYMCRGTDDNGRTWGCGARFYRKYDLNRHKKRKGGAKCLFYSSPERLTMEESQSMDAALTLFDIASANTPSVGGLIMQPTLESEASARSAAMRPPLLASTLKEFSASTHKGNHSSKLPRPRQASASSIHSRDYILDLAEPGRPSSSSSRVPKHPATFQCSLCPKKFFRAYNLRSHLRTHTDERPFVCTVCGKAFAQQHERKRHEDLHSGEKKFVCKGELNSKPGETWGCGRRFARVDALGRHFRSEAGRVCIRPLLEEEAAIRLTLASSTTHEDRGQTLSNPGENGLAQLPYQDIDSYLALHTYSEINIEFPLTPEMLYKQNLELDPTHSWRHLLAVQM